MAVCNNRKQNCLESKKINRNRNGKPCCINNSLPTCPRFKISGRLSLPYLAFAFPEIVPNAPIAMGITVTLVALTILLISRDRSYTFQGYFGPLAQQFREVSLLCVIVYYSNIWTITFCFSRLSVKKVITQANIQLSPEGEVISGVIYQDAKHRGIYLALFTDPGGDSSFSTYQISWIKVKKVTFCKLKTSLSGNFDYNLRTSPMTLPHWTNQNAFPSLSPTT